MDFRFKSEVNVLCFVISSCVLRNGVVKGNVTLSFSFDNDVECITFSVIFHLPLIFYNIYLGPTTFVRDSL